MKIWFVWTLLLLLTEVIGPPEANAQIHMTVGQAGPVSASYVCVQTRDGLEALEVIRGRPHDRRAPDLRCPPLRRPLEHLLRGPCRYVF